MEKLWNFFSGDLYEPCNTNNIIAKKSGPNDCVIIPTMIVTIQPTQRK